MRASAGAARTRHMSMATTSAPARGVFMELPPRPSSSNHCRQPPRHPGSDRWWPRHSEPPCRRPFPNRAGNSPIVTQPLVRPGTSGPRRRRRGGRVAALISGVSVVAVVLAIVIAHLGPSGPRPAQAQSSGKPAASASAAQAHLASAASWRAVPVTLPAGAAAPATQNATLWAIACPTAATCVATGDYLDASRAPQGLIETLSHGHWVPAEAPFHARHQAVSLDGVACASAGACVSVGYYEYDNNKITDGLIETLSHGTWTSVEAPLPADAATGSQVAILQSVACPAVGTCVAVGGYRGQNSAAPGLIEMLSNGTWTPVDASLPAGAALTQQASINSVACSAVGTCVAAGTYVDQNNVYQSLVETLSNGTWTAAEVPRPAGAIDSKDAGLSAISCPTADICVATGWYNYTGNPFQASQI